MEKQHGFTLVELVMVIIIIGALAGVAVPKALNLGSSARVASVNTLAGAVRSTALNLHVMCKLNAACDYSQPGQYFVFSGKGVGYYLGWPDAGDCLDCSQIDSWVNYTGFTAALVPTSATRFTLDGSPDPTNCSVTYFDNTGYFNDNTVHLETATSGC